jgi:hypothetical protein
MSVFPSSELYQQLELFENDSDDEADDKSNKKDGKPKEPNQETGYLTCKICLSINHYEFPRKDYICRGCIVFDEWITKK